MKKFKINVQRYICIFLCLVLYITVLPFSVSRLTMGAAFSQCCSSYSTVSSMRTVGFTAGLSSWMQFAGC